LKLIVGLGNPGREYQGTRHNVGFDVVDRLAEKLGWVRPGEFDRVAKSKFDALTYDGVVDTLSHGPEKLLLIKPLTFMNLSGKSVRAAMDFYTVAPADVLVILDDLALPCGKLRLRGSGSPGGHNGLKHIERVLGTQAYPRLRIGIDPTPPRMAGADYVLGKWTDEQKSRLEPGLVRACGAILTWVDLGIDKAMTQFNVDP